VLAAFGLPGRARSLTPVAGAWYTASSGSTRPPAATRSMSWPGLVAADPGAALLRSLDRRVAAALDVAAAPNA